MNTIMLKLRDIIIEYPKWILGIVVLILIACIPSLFEIKADRAISSFIPRGHISYAQKLEIQRIYNINDPLFVDISDRISGDIFTPTGLKFIQTISHFVEDLPGIKPGSVRSLDTHEDIIGLEDSFNVKHFLEPFPTTLEQAQAVKQRVKAFPLYEGLLISQNGMRSGIIADFEDNADVLFVFAEFEKLRAKVESETNFAIKVTGAPIVMGTLNVYLNQDALILDPIAAIFTALLLFVSLRSLGGVLLPLSVVMPALMVAFASMAWLGYAFTPFSNAIPVVTIATSIADSMHFLSAYFDLRLQQPQLSVKAVVTKVYSDVWPPIVLTSVTTAAGFLMLIQGSPMLPVNNFGITVAIGVMVAMVFSLFMLPAAIVVFEPKPSLAFARLYAARVSGQTSYWDRIVAWLMGRVINNLSVAIGFLLVVTMIGIVGVTRLYADYEPITFFPPDSNVYTDFHTIREHYVGMNLLEVDIDTGIEDGIYTPQFLNRLDKLQERIEAWKPVGGTMSIADYLKKMNQAFHADKPEFYTIANSADANAQFFLLYNFSGDPRRFDEVADGNRQRANLRIFLKHGNYAQSGPFIRWLEQEVPKTFPESKVKFGGETYVIFNWMAGIAASVALSILLSGLCMYLICLPLLKSFFGGILLLVPIGIATFLTYAFIGAVGVAVGLGTSAFASIAMGVGIDFAIHFLWRYRDERQTGLNHFDAMQRVMESVGKGILFNGIVVIGGFCVIMLSTTTPPQQLGEYVAISIAASLATTFLVLSVATRWWAVVR